MAVSLPFVLAFLPDFVTVDQLIMELSLVEAEHIAERRGGLVGLLLRLAGLRLLLQRNMMEYTDPVAFSDLVVKGSALSRVSQKARAKIMQNCKGLLIKKTPNLLSRSRAFIVVFQRPP